jgi:hypothetical protein
LNFTSIELVKSNPVPKSEISKRECGDWGKCYFVVNDR